MLSAPVQLSYFPQRSHARIRMAYAAFGSAAVILEASRSGLRSCGWTDPIIDAFFTWRDQFDPSTTAHQLQQAGVNTITREDEYYPPQLRQLHDIPLCLFIRGALAHYTTSLAVVGTRNMSTYGSLIIDTLIPPLVQAGVTIVSGLAYGVDSAAHRATLQAGGITHAVLGSGVDSTSITPTTHHRLAQDIISSGGSILSEYPPGTRATKYSFPERNRIIAALTRATLVVEAGEKSGSLITASCALELDRDIAAIPHPIHMPLGKGPNMLIKQGAHVITSVEDLTTLLGIADVSPKIKDRTHEMTPTEYRIHTLLQTEAKHIDDIIHLLQIDGMTVMSTISIMEMRDLIRHTGGMTYIAC